METKVRVPYGAANAGTLVQERTPAAQAGSWQPVSLRALLIEPTANTFIQFIRYSVVGSAALAIDFAALFLLTHYAGIHYLKSAAVAFLAGLAVNYALSTIWVFSSRKQRNRLLEFAVFAAVGVAGLGLNELGMWLFTGRLQIHYMWAKAITAAVVYIWNFGARKAALFR